MITARPAEPRDDGAVACLLYESASGRYDLFAGGRDRALRLLRATIARSGNDTSRDGVLVAEVDGEVAGALAAFPASEARDRSRAWLRLALRRRAPWQWPRMLRIAGLGERIDFEPPPDSLYIDGLATDSRFRRRGVAVALLDAAAERARERGLTALALDTSETNLAAQMLYERAGFGLVGRQPGDDPIPPTVFYVRDVA
jgi:ribosomal protein S18 acetylase RimI-like enzyme